MFIAGIDLVDASGEVENAGAGEMIEDLFASPLVLDDTGLTQDREVARCGGDRATGRLSQLAGADWFIPQSMNDRHATGMAEGLEDFGLAQQRIVRWQGL